MATQAQINANRANAQKSTGPKSAEGKAKSSLNRVSHGFNSAALFIAGENREEFDALLADLTNEFQPATPSEQILVEKMVHNQWNSLRAIRFQSVLLDASVPHGYMHPDLGLLIRYQASADRAYHKAHAELLKARKERLNSEIGFESQTPAAAPEAAPKTPETTPPITTAYPAMPEYTPVANKLAAELGITHEELLHPRRFDRNAA
jgi:hypothetical protein